MSILLPWIDRECLGGKTYQLVIRADDPETRERIRPLLLPNEPIDGRKGTHSAWRWYIPVSSEPEASAVLAKFPGVTPNIRHVDDAFREARIKLPADGWKLVESARQIMSRHAGRDLSMGTVLERLCMDFLSGDEESWQKKAFGLKSPDSRSDASKKNPGPEGAPPDAGACPHNDSDSAP